MEASANTSKQKEGSWIGIDLGTTNCTAAIWDLNTSQPKVLRLGYRNLARPVESGKGGKIVPSVVMFYESRAADKSATGCDDSVAVGEHGASIEGMSTLVGYQAIQSTCDEMNVRNTNVDQATVTSFKRVIGMTQRQAKELQSSDPGFWQSLPFQSVILDVKTNKQKHKELDSHMKSEQLPDSSSLYDVLTESSMKSQATVSKSAQEGVAISIKPLPYNPLSTVNKEQSSTNYQSSKERLVTPLQVTTLLLTSIRHAANAHLIKSKSKICAPGTQTATCINCQNCIIGVPAHYSHSQRSAIQSAAKNAGFKGYVGVMTESTAAALAYGLFVSPNVRREDKEKQILVFDMGGGTTDVTVAIMTAETSGDNVTGDEVRFKVVATAGDRCLGGDNVDELLARHLWKKIESSSSEEETTLEWEASQHQELMRKCRLAKEQLCGNEKEDEVGLSKTHFTINGSRVDITRQEFDMAIQPLIDRAENVVDDALKQLHSSDVTAPIHEVVLVGGSSHIPTVRDMLRRKFPPPIPPDLCTSISAETAVAQGLAIQSALVSGDVPLWELRNAMMLDALPHSIGVWVDPRPPIDGSGARYDKGDVLHLRDKSDCHYVEILQKDDPLPARGSATFTLADISQFGVTVVAVERIGANTFQCMGVFSFLLHKLDLQQFSSECTRQVDVGMVLESNGRFVVSVFDNNDPEHRKRKRQFLRQRGIEDDDEEYINEVRYSGTESSLLILCAIVFVIYVATRVAFSELDLQHDDEL